MWYIVGMRFLTIEQVAEKYDRSPSAARVWAQRGELPGAFKVHARLWLVDAHELDSFEPPKRGRRPGQNGDGREGG